MAFLVFPRFAKWVSRKIGKKWTLNIYLFLAPYFREWCPLFFKCCGGGGCFYFHHGDVITAPPFLLIYFCFPLPCESRNTYTRTRIRLRLLLVSQVLELGCWLSSLPRLFKSASFIVTRNRTVISDATHSKDSFSFDLFLQLKNEILCDLLVDVKVKSDHGLKRWNPFVADSFSFHRWLPTNYIKEQHWMHSISFWFSPPWIGNSLHQSRISFEVNILWWKWFFVLYFF